MKKVIISSMFVLFNGYASHELYIKQQCTTYPLMKHN